MGTYRDLLAWQKSIKLAKAVYQLTANYPSDERFGLTNQMRRCSISIPSNIAEGFGRGSDKELVQFLYISLGSSNELDTQLTVSYELSFITEDKFREMEKLNNEVNKMLQSLIYRRKKGLDSNNLK
ncbi:four helix bundle protein [Mediterranea massiliensis]|uniref:four helix bundle protein n=1 Tax=Mediterranea massiliensis TaxID=1841865 RepID=UPI0025A4A75C|nr:four helix bundle protein [Mediterranea massiliensis]MDM8339085.1 four helix bundle protein [Mediterranea massiliensis]